MKNRSRYIMTIIELKYVGTKYNPLAYTDRTADDLTAAVEVFFEDASIEVHYSEIERIAKELADNGFSYWKNKFLFNVF